MNNYNNIERNSVNDTNIPVKRSGKKHVGLVFRKVGAGVIIASLIGGAIAISNKGEAIPVSYGNVVTSTNNNSIDFDGNKAIETPSMETQVEKTEEEIKEEKVNKLFSDMYKYATENEIKDLGPFYEEHYFEINYDVNSPEVNKDMMYLYAANAYKKAHDKGLDNKTITNELSVMYTLQELPGCLFDEDAKKMENLIGTLNPESEGLFMTYNSLAILVHNETCEKEHVLNAAGGISHEGEEPEFETGFQLKLTK